MFRRTALAIVMSSALAAVAVAAPESRDPAQVPAGEYVLDARHASLTAKVSHLGGFSNYAMRFDKLSGGFTWDPANPAAAKATIRIDPASIHTGLPNFDKELAGPRWFNAAAHPAITFVSTKVDAGADGRGKIIGDLTFLGVTKPVTLDVTFNGVGPGMMGTGTRLGFSGTGMIKRSDFGLTTSASAAGDEVMLDFEVEFTKK
ncbi:YceI family protein [Phenylobacterium terrae]|uniref:YceI family protein n=1 Tax=Phenylobacterium terrae TaxID=2665495 RepID=A0ABW4N1F8_9CAUL